MRSARLVSLAVVVGFSATMLATSTSEAATQVAWETGTVRDVIDGDTVWVDIAGDGTSSTKSVRLLGIQAMEAYHPSIQNSVDECHAAAPREELDRLVLGKQVRLYSVKKSSTSLGRLLRSVYVQQGSTWVDVQRILLQKSMVLPVLSTTESVHNTDYMKVAQLAAQSGTGLWNPTSCGSGPSQDISLKLIVHYDAQSDDSTNVNDEWVSIQNPGTRTISLKDWFLRDSSLTFFYFPSDTTVAPGQRVTMRVGKGTNSAATKYWGQSSPVFDNAGDGAYLFDPNGDLRTWMMYPCLVSCTDPEQGNLEISSVRYDATGVDDDNVNGEYLRVHNISDHRIHMRPYQIRSLPYSFTFSINQWIEPNQYLKLHVGKGTPTTTSLYWGKTAAILGNSGDKVELITYDDIELACRAWGTVSC